jgi:CubicO group peptidase (beta-lactamase class C family)
MTMTRWLFARAAPLALVLAWCAYPLAAEDLPAAQPAELGLSQDRLARLDAMMTTAVEQGRVPGAVVLIARKGRVAHYEAYGQSDASAGRAMERDDIFRIYSMTKPVVSVALMMLHEEGKFQLTDPLEMYIPAFKGLKVFAGTDESGEMVLEDAKRKPTIQDAFRHTLGLANAGLRTPIERRYLDLGITFTKLESLDQEIELLGQIPLAYQPGERWLYGKGHDVQAYLVERLSGMPLDQFLEQRLFRPLGMNDTSYGVPAEKVDRIAQYDSEIAWPDPNNPGLDMRAETYDRFATRPFGTMGLSSTAMDFARFSQMLLNGGELDGVRILGRKSVELMTKNNLPANIGDLAATGDPGIGYGLGMSVALDAAAAGNVISPGTFGWTGAATTSFMIDPKEELVAILMTQKWPYDTRLLSEFQTMAYQTIAD